VLLLLQLFSWTLYVIFQMRLSEECSSLHATVSQLKFKLESCQKKLEAKEHQLQEKECEAIQYCNALEVISYFILLSFTITLRLKRQ